MPLLFLRCHYFFKVLLQYNNRFLLLKIQYFAKSKPCICMVFSHCSVSFKGSRPNSTRHKKRPAVVSRPEAETQGFPPLLIFSHPLPSHRLNQGSFFLREDAWRLFNSLYCSLLLRKAWVALILKAAGIYLKF